MSTAVAEYRSPDALISPTCSKFRCTTTFEIPYRDRLKVRYCPEHDFSGYWTNQSTAVADADSHVSMHDHPLWDKFRANENVKIVVNNKRYSIAVVSPSGKRVKVRMGGGQPRAMWFDETDGLVLL